MIPRNRLNASPDQSQDSPLSSEQQPVGWWNSTPAKVMKVLWSVLAAPFSVMFELLKGLIFFIKNPSDYNHTLVSGPKDHPDKTAIHLPFGFAGARLGGTFTTIIAGLWLLGFTASLLVPIPGIAPLYTLATTGMAKYGVLLLATLIGRTIGAAIGNIIDYARNKALLEQQYKTNNKKEKIKEGFNFILKCTLIIGIAGENGRSLREIGQSLSYAVSNCFSFSSRKAAEVEMEDAAAATTSEAEKLKDGSRSSSADSYYGGGNNTPPKNQNNSQVNPCFSSTFGRLQDQLQSQSNVSRIKIAEQNGLQNNYPVTELAPNLTPPPLAKYRSMPDLLDENTINAGSVIKRLTI